MSEFDWDPFAGDRMKFENIGDQIKGKVSALRTEVGQKGEKLPVVVLQLDAEGTEREVWAGTTDLKQQLAALRPQVGWWLAIEFVGTKHTGQAQPMKLFEVRCKEPSTNGAGPAQAREALNPTPPAPEVEAFADLGATTVDPAEYDDSPF